MVLTGEAQAFTVSCTYRDMLALDMFGFNIYRLWNRHRNLGKSTLRCFICSNGSAILFLQLARYRRLHMKALRFCCYTGIRGSQGLHSFQKKKKVVPPLARKSAIARQLIFCQGITIMTSHRMFILFKCQCSWILRSLSIKSGDFYGPG